MNDLPTSPGNPEEGSSPVERAPEVQRVRRRRRRSRSEEATSEPSSVLLRLASAAASLASLAAGCLLAVHHPTFGVWFLLPMALAIALTAWLPGAWPRWLLPLLPLIGGMPWTGWLVVEELDLLALAAAAGGYARWTMTGPPRTGRTQSIGALLGAAVLAAYLMSLFVSMERGIADAGGLVLGWWQGYYEPLNSVRLAKSLPLVLLLLPLWLRQQDRRSDPTTEHFLAGMTGMLATIGLTVVWERFANTGLTNFTTDYRATGLFWEMHVGGAALDAALVLAFPFAAVALLRARSPAGWIFSGAALALGGYAALTSFSRVVYVGVPLGLALVAIAWLRQSARNRSDVRTGSVVATIALLCAFAAAAFSVFPVGGYRGLAAALGVFALLPAAVAAVPGMPVALRVVGIAGGAVLAAAYWGIYQLLPKGAYLGYVALAGAAVIATVLALWRLREGQAPWPPAAVLLLASVVGLSPGIAWISMYWGETSSASGSGLVAAIAPLVIAIAAAAGRSPWPASLRGHAVRGGMLGMVGLVVAVFSGGSYMGDRWSSLENDFGTRVTHAQGALALLHGPADEIVGRGLGRYAASRLLSGSQEDQTGTVLWTRDDGAWRMLLTSGKHVLGWGEIFRVSQRIDEPGGNARVRVRMRTKVPVDLHAEVCEKHLLYNEACLVGLNKIAHAVGEWHTFEWPLQGDTAPTRGFPLAQRFITFSLALASPGTAAEISSIELFDAQGAQLIANPTFANGGARWFFSSDRHHMPWHAKNLAVHLLFEQGIAGFALFSLLCALALWRVTLGKLRDDPLAPAVLGSLIGVFVVGTGDSLLDMPRIAFVVYLVLGAAVLLGHREPDRGRG